MSYVNPTPAAAYIVSTGVFEELGAIDHTTSSGLLAYLAGKSLSSCRYVAHRVWSVTGLVESEA